MIKKSSLVCSSILISLFVFSCSTTTQPMIIADNTNIQSVKKNKPQLKAQNNIKIISDITGLNPETKKIVDMINKSSKDLTLISESDEPFKSFVWKSKATEKIDSKKLLEILKLNPKLKSEKQSEGLNWLKDYSTTKYWTDGGYSEAESKKLASSYAKFIKDLSMIKDLELFLVDDPSNLDDSSYDSKDDFSGAVGFYLFGKVGNDIVGVSSALVWT